MPGSIGHGRGGHARCIGSVCAPETPSGLPSVRAQGPSVAKNYGLPLAPVLVIDLRAVFCRDRRHGYPLSYVSVQLNPPFVLHNFISYAANRYALAVAKHRRIMLATRRGDADETTEFFPGRAVSSEVDRFSPCFGASARRQVRLEAAQKSISSIPGQTWLQRFSWLAMERQSGRAGRWLRPKARTWNGNG